MTKLLLLTVLLTVVQTAPPVPRQTTNSAASASAKVQKKGNSHQAAPAPSQPPANANTTPPPDNKGQNQSANDAEHAVVIRKSVPVTVSTQRDWFDWGVWVFSGLLVVVGILQGIILWRQAKIMRTHAEHLENLTAALETTNKQSALFFKLEKRPWVGVSRPLLLLDKQSTKPGQYGFTLRYVVKNFGTAPAFNTIVAFEDTIDDPNDYKLIKAKVAEARNSGENIVKLTGDLLLPTVEKGDTCQYSERVRPNKFAIAGCIIYRSTDGSIHYTELSYWIDLAEGEKAVFRTLWFQDAN